MRVVQRSREAVRRLWVDRAANLQIIETMIVGLLVVSAVVAVSTLNVPTTTTEGFKQDNERLVDDTLSAMLARPSEAQSGTLFGSVLEEYVMEAIAGNPSPLMDHLNKTLPGGAMYNVYLDNGHGAPYPVIDTGSPPREAVAASSQFVPRLAYTFMLPEFGLNHGDFDMNMYAVPVLNGLLLHDEGDPLELAVTFEPLDDNGQPIGSSFTLKTYGHTALRDNDPLAREWPSVSLWYNSGTYDFPTRSYYMDATLTPLYGDRIDNVENGCACWTGDAYNLTFEVAVEETAGVEVPRNAQITLEFPRGWDFNKTKRDAVANGSYFRNTDHWEDWTFKGSVMQGWVVTAHLKEAFSGQRVPLNISSNYRTIFDTAYPYFNPVTVYMGGGVQGIATIIVEPPSNELFGVLRRDAYLSVPKPIIGGDTSYWGAGFTNMGEDVQITNVTIKQPQSLDLVASMQHHQGTTPGSWNKLGPGHFYWEEANGDPVTVLRGKQAWFGIEAVAANTQDNHYRNQDYQKVLAYYNPDNTTGANTIGTWEYHERLLRMGEEWVYRDVAPPSDGDPVQGYTPGWPDEDLNTYWVGGGTYIFKRTLLGNTSYDVLPSGASSNAFGDYQGHHVFSDMDLENDQGVKSREYALGEKVNIKNDFSALITNLTLLDATSPISITDMKVNSRVYTPEKAWKGIPTAQYSQSADIALDTGRIRILVPVDLNDDGTMDVIAVGSGGVMFALDGRDGTKLWVHDANANTKSAAIIDADSDGDDELVIGTDSGVVMGIDASIDDIANRLLWSTDVGNALPSIVDPYHITDILTFPSAPAGEPNIVVSVKADNAPGYLVGLEAKDSSGWSAAEVDRYAVTDVLRSAASGFTDLAAVTRSDSTYDYIAAASVNRTVAVFDFPDLSPVWISDLVDHPLSVVAADLNGDGDDEVVVNTHDADGFQNGGHDVLVLQDTTGAWAPKERSLGAIERPKPTEAAVSSTGALFTVGTHQYILQDTTGMYKVGLGWPNVHAQGDPFNLGGVEPFLWRGLHVQGDTGYVIEEGGEIRGTTIELGLEVSGGFNWEKVAKGVVPPLEKYMDLHIPPNFDANEPGWRFTEGGKAYRSIDDGGNWTHMASACADGSGEPNTGVSCTNFAVDSWWIDEDVNGIATGFWALSNRATTLLPTPEYDSYLYRYDVAADTWTEYGTFTDMEAKALFVTAAGTPWVGGQDDGTNDPYLAKWSTGTSWTAATFVTEHDGMDVDSIVIPASGGGWAASSTGTVWRLNEGSTWVVHPVDGLASATSVALTEDLDGTMWLVTDFFVHVPLRVHESESWVYLQPVFQGLTDMPGTPPSTITIEATEGHLGGVYDDEPTVALRPITDITFEYKRAADTTWTTLPHDDLGTDPGIVNKTHAGGIDCNPVSACADLELRAQLKTRTLSDPTESMRRDPGLSPLLRSIKVDLTGGVNVPHETLTVNQATMLPTSDAMYSAFHEGAILKEGFESWSFRGLATGSGSVANRYIDAADDSIETANAPGDVAIVEVATSGQYKHFLLDGDTGVPISVATPSSPPTGASDDVEAILLTDATGDGWNDLVMAGELGGKEGVVRIYDAKNAQFLDAPDTGMDDVFDFVPAGLKNGRQMFVVSGWDDLESSPVAADEADEVAAILGPLGAQAPTSLWVSVPSEAQGKATFIYTIPDTAMYGTAIVVSEMQFTITESSQASVQTARLVEWFNIKPPNKPVPSPPIYTIEIVSWFNDG